MKKFNSEKNVACTKKSQQTPPPPPPPTTTTIATIAMTKSPVRQHQYVLGTEIRFSGTIFFALFLPCIVTDLWLECQSDLRRWASL